MKPKIYFLIALFAVVLSNAQSISAIELLSYVNSQNTTSISSKLKVKGFTRNSVIREGYVMYDFTKGSEKVSITQNSELFMVVYYPTYSAYSVIKNKLLTREFHYAYNYKNNDYYESSYMRIGANDKNGIVSVFKPLK